MKRLKKMLLLIASMTFLLLFASGCGATVSTTMTLDESFKGNRTVTYDFSKTDVDENITGGIDKLNEIIDANLPDGLTYTIKDNGDSYTYTFVIEFSSYDDYVAKVEKILGEKPTITYENADTTFSSGLMLDESFSAADLQQWFTDAVDEAGIIVDGYGAYNLYDTYNTKVIYEGTEYDSYSYYVNVDTTSSIGFSEIRVLTSINEDGTYDRTIILGLDYSTSYDLTDDTKSTLEKLAPEGAEIEWTGETEDYQALSITFTAADTAELAEKTTTVMCANVDPMTDIYVEDDTFLLGSRAYTNEKFDLAQFATGSYGGSVKFSYYLKGADTSEGSFYYLDEDTTSSFNCYPEYYESEYEGYDLMISSYGSDFDFYLYDSTSCEIDALDVNITLKSFDEATAKIELQFAGVVSEEYLQAAIKSLEAIGTNSTKFSYEVGSKNSTITITLSGEFDDINKDLDKIGMSTYGSNEISATSYSDEAGSFYMYFNFDTMLSGALTEDVVTHFTLSTENSYDIIKVDESNYADSTTELYKDINENTYSLDFNGAYFSLSAELEKTASFASILIIAVIIVVVLLVVVLIFAAGKKKKKGNAQNNGAPGYNPNAQNMNGVPGYNPNAQNNGMPGYDPNMQNPYAEPVQNADMQNPYAEPVQNADMQNPYAAPVQNADMQNPYAAPVQNTEEQNNEDIK